MFDWKEYHAANIGRGAYGIITGPELLERLAVETRLMVVVNDGAPPRLPRRQDKRRGAQRRQVRRR